MFKVDRFEIFTDGIVSRILSQPIFDHAVSFLYLPPKTFKLLFCNLLTMGVPGEGYPRDAASALNYISIGYFFHPINIFFVFHNWI